MVFITKFDSSILVLVITVTFHSCFIPNFHFSFLFYSFHSSVSFSHYFLASVLFYYWLSFFSSVLFLAIILQCCFISNSSCSVLFYS